MSEEEEIKDLFHTTIALARALVNDDFAGADALLGDTQFPPEAVDLLGTMSWLLECAVTRISLTEDIPKSMVWNNLVEVVDRAALDDESDTD